MTTVVLFGGSFDPPHIAHVLVACYVHSMHAIDKLLVVPCFRHPFAKSLQPFDARLAMCKAAFDWLPNTEVSTVEAQLGGESRTLRTVQHLRSQHPAWNLRLLMGADILSEARHWHAFDEVTALAPPIVVPRAGQGENAMFPAISSTLVRNALSQGLQPTEWLSPQVLAIIQSQGLYKPGNP